MCVGNFESFKDNTTHITTSALPDQIRRRERGRKTHHCWRRGRRASPAVVAGVAGVGFKRGNEGVGEGDRGSKYKGKLEEEKRKIIPGGEGRNHAGGL